MPRLSSRPSAIFAALSVAIAAGPAKSEAPAAAAPSAAPSTPGQARKPAGTSGPVVTEIVVTASRPAVETRIDRRVYAVSGDLQGDIGSAADVLRNIPSVSVDLEGNPSLRGDPDVQILIDGRYRPEFNGPDKGAALEALAAQGIDRIEILTNPPASFKRDGSAGIINIITRRSHEARTARLQTGVGSNGRWDVTGSTTAQLGDLALRGSAKVRHDLRVRDITDQRTVRDDAGAVINEREQRTDTSDDRVYKKVSIGADYDVGANDRLSGEISYYRRDTDGLLHERVDSQDANGTALSGYERERRSNGYEYNSDVLLRYHHAGAGDDDGLTISLQQSEDEEHPDWKFKSTFSTPQQSDQFFSQRPDEHELSTDFTVDYAITLGDKQRFTAGYELELDDQTSDFWQSLPVTAGGADITDPAFTNKFRDEQAIHALYATYERPFGAWTALAGVRLEQASADLHQVTSNERHNLDYFRAYPSLHVSRKLDEQQALTFSYARRVQRPWPQDMNPFVVQVDPNYLRKGNPDLKPSEIDSFDFGWNYDAGSTSFSASIYAKRRYDVKTTVRTLVTPTVELETTENLGDVRSGGLELTASGKLGGAFSYNLSANLFYDEIDATNLGFRGMRSTFSRDAKAALNWRMTEQDRLQINLAALGRRLSPQGYWRGSATMDLGYRHQFGSGLSATATLTDVFASKLESLVLETPELSQRSTTRPAGRILWLGLTWTMASEKEKSADKFEYEN